MSPLYATAGGIGTTTYLLPLGTKCTHLPRVPAIAQAESLTATPSVASMDSGYTSARSKTRASLRTPSVR